MTGDFTRVNKRNWLGLPLGEIYDSVIAFVFQTTIPRILQKRYRAGIGKFESHYPFEDFLSDDEESCYGTLPDSVVAKHFGLTHDAVAMRRKCAGIDSFYALEIEKFLNRYTHLLPSGAEFQVYGRQPTLAATIDWQTVDFEKHTEAELAKRLNVHPMTVFKHRRFLKRKSAESFRHDKGEQRERWTTSTRKDAHAQAQLRRYSLPEHFPLKDATLGSCADGVLARWCDTDAATINRKRNAAGIPRYDDPSRFEAILARVGPATPRERLPYTKVPGTLLALHLGVKPGTLSSWRRKFGIESFDKASEARFLASMRKNASARARRVARKEEKMSREASVLPAEG